MLFKYNYLTVVSNSKQGKGIIVFVNGKRNDCGRRITITTNDECLNEYTWDDILDYLTLQLKPAFGRVQKLFSLNESCIVTSFRQLVVNGKYVACGLEPVRVLRGGYLTEGERTKFERNHLKKRLNTRAILAAYIYGKKQNCRIIFVFRNGDSKHEPFMFVFQPDELNDWDYIIACISYNINPYPGVVERLYTVQGVYVRGPWDLKHLGTYVAVEFHDQFKYKPYFRNFHNDIVRKFRSFEASNGLTPKRNKAKQTKALEQTEIPKIILYETIRSITMQLPNTNNDEESRTNLTKKENNASPKSVHNLNPYLVQLDKLLNRTSYAIDSVKKDAYLLYMYYYKALSLDINQIQMKSGIDTNDNQKSITCTDSICTSFTDKCKKNIDQCIQSTFTIDESVDRCKKRLEKVNKSVEAINHVSCKKNERTVVVPPIFIRKSFSEEINRKPYESIAQNEKPSFYKISKDDVIIKTAMARDSLSIDTFIEQDRILENINNRSLDISISTNQTFVNNKESIATNSYIMNLEKDTNPCPCYFTDNFCLCNTDISDKTTPICSCKGDHKAGKSSGRSSVFKDHYYSYCVNKRAKNNKDMVYCNNKLDDSIHLSETYITNKCSCTGKFTNVEVSETNIITELHRSRSRINLFVVESAESKAKISVKSEEAAGSRVLGPTDTFQQIINALEKADFPAHHAAGRDKADKDNSKMSVDSIERISSDTSYKISDQTRLLETSSELCELYVNSKPTVESVLNENFIKIIQNESNILDESGDTNRIITSFSKIKNFFIRCFT